MNGEDLYHAEPAFDQLAVWLDLRPCALAQRPVELANYHLLHAAGADLLRRYPLGP